MSSQLPALLELAYTCKIIGCEETGAYVPRPTEWHFEKELMLIIITSKRDIIADVK